ncbi:MAG: ADOP family duplicated permease, partial [Gemmatimonadetes bacterium]|nr:ADOP family duplicated permease [Gemmatimonadota bacterium]
RSPLRGVEAETELWLPFGLDPARARNINFSLQAFARLAPGVARERVETELDARFARPFELYPNEGVTAEDIRQMGVRVSVRPLQETVVGDIGGVLWVVMAAVGVILLIACANVANLFLVQAEGRDREVAVRSAIGASRRRVARTFLVESCGLGLVSGVAGLGLAALALRVGVQFGPRELPRLAEVGLDGSALAFTLVASLATGLAFGSFPVARLRSWRTVIALKEGGRGGSGGKKRNRARNGLVVAQLALALVLLAGSGLLLRTFWNLRSVDPGFRAENVLTFRVSLPFREYPGDDPALDFHRALLERIEASPGVVSATAGPFGFPIQTTGNTNPVWIEDEPTPPGQMPTQRPIRIAMPGYFETLGIPLVSGRSIERRDIDLGTGAVVVSRSFVDLHWPDEDPLGKRIRAMPDAEWLTIVGVAGDVRQDALHQVPAPTVYLGARLTGGDTYAGVGAMTYGVRTEGDPTTAIPVVREALHEIDPNVPLADVSTLEVAVDRSMARTSFTMVLLGITSVVALMLGAVGIYGVMAYVVSQRTREVGVRMALGAAPPTVLRLVLGEAAIVVGVGLALGLVGATGLTHVLRSLLFGVDPLDPLTLGAVAVALAGAALVASLLPARRAARVDPMVALRHECG